MGPMNASIRGAAYNRTPVIQVNDLRSDAERDEQRGFMHLFKGIVGVRNAVHQDHQPVSDPHSPFLGVLRRGRPAQWLRGLPSAGVGLSGL